jgi:hypothetical protein
MSQVDRRRRRVLGPLGSLGVWALFALIAWLDSDHCALALRPGFELHTAAVFSFIVAGIEALAGYLASAAEVTAVYVAQAVVWLAGRVGTILKSTGAMFAKVWDASKIVWSDVLKPALHWLSTELTKLHDWLKTTFKPVFEWLKIARDHVLDIYKRFVRPIIDTIEFIRSLNRVLLLFHIKFLQQLDAVLQKVEQRIEEPFLWIYQELTAIWSWVDRIIDFDGYYQRLTLARSMQRYAPDWINHFWRRQGVTDTNGDGGSPVDTSSLDVDPTTYGESLSAFLKGEDSPITAYVGELVPLFNQAAGITAESNA